ncbi:MAG: hypothetical protein GY797_40635 [Deltaproteobacteria bacterium]|nr:hypothetical protein [Deltaproteobacteria bacterium]
MGVTDILTGLKDKVLDAATYELLKRNFELLEKNYQYLKDKIEFQKEEIEKLKMENLRLIGQNAGLWAEYDISKSERTFFIRDGIALRKNITGEVNPEPCCPKCHEIMSTVDHKVYMCVSCPYTIFLIRKLSEIVAELNNEE